MLSILHDGESCYICGGDGGYWGLDWHHVFGASNRRKSEKYGLKVRLCHDKCHINGVHKNREMNRKLKKEVQEKAMNWYGWNMREWIDIFGENYLLED